jgi:hypothetical protein
MKSAAQINAANPGHAEAATAAPQPYLAPLAPLTPVNVPLHPWPPMDDVDAARADQLPLARRIRDVANELGSGCLRAEAITALFLLADQLEGPVSVGDREMGSVGDKETVRL